MANKEYIERLVGVIAHLHKCDAEHIDSVPVHEAFRGKILWQGDVEVFNLTGHPKAKRAYGWSHPDGPKNMEERFVTVLELPPVTSPETAVKVAVAGEIRQKRKAGAK